MAEGHTKPATGKDAAEVKPLTGPQGYGHDRLRIGYLSSDFCSHAVSILTAELYGLHDRSKVEVFGFCWSHEDGSPIRARVIAGDQTSVSIAAGGSGSFTSLVSLSVSTPPAGITASFSPSTFAFVPRRNHGSTS